MAQPTSGPYPHPSDYPITLFGTAHHSARISHPHPTGTPTPTEFTGNKKELLHGQSGSKPTGNALDDRPNKRQRAVEKGSSHKFVSQKKWKFANSQPWLPSKVSSKAQNASGSVSRAKVEPESPELSSRLIAKSFRTTNEPSNGQIVALQSTDGASEKQAFLFEIQHCRNGSLPMQANNSSERSAKAAANNCQSGSTPSYHSVSNNKSGVHLTDRSSLSHNESRIPDVTPIGLIQSDLNMPKTNAGNGTLCLETDAEQIAALIAEKRRENESSMFRERLLQRQLQHKGHKEESDVQRNSRASSTNEPDLLHNPQSVQRRSKDTISENHVNISVLSETPSAGAHTKQSQPLQTRRTQTTTVLRSTVETPNTIRADTTGAKNVPTQALNLSSMSMQPQVTHHRHSDISGSQSRSKQGIGSIHLQMQPTAKVTARDEAASFLAEETQVTGPLNAFNSELITRAISANAHTRILNGGHQGPQSYHNRHTMSPPSISYTQNLQRTCSTSSTTVQCSAEMLKDPVPSVTSLSSVPSPTTASMQQFANIDISPHIPQDSVYPSPLNYNEPITVNHSPANTTKYHATKRQTWAFPEQHIDRRGVMPALRDTPRTIAYSYGKASTLVQQQSPSLPAALPRTPPLDSNTRPRKSNKERSGMPKQRVNMFSNTKGAPFPMHEVIRQIEMT